MVDVVLVWFVVADGHINLFVRGSRCIGRWFVKLWHITVPLHRIYVPLCTHWNRRAYNNGARTCRRWNFREFPLNLYMGIVAHISPLVGPACGKSWSFTNDEKYRCYEDSVENKTSSRDLTVEQHRRRLTYDEIHDESVCADLRTSRAPKFLSFSATTLSHYTCR